MATNIPKVNADFYPERINMYVPAMAYASDCGNDGRYMVSLGMPIVGDVDLLLDGQSTAAAGNADMDVTLDGDFGRCLVYDCSGANTDLVTVTGFDYLGQPITEQKALNGTTVVPGTKAFRRVTNVAWLLQAGETIDIGTGDVLGLPYKTIAVEYEIGSGVLQSAGAFIAAVITDPAIATTGDPRGTYNPTEALDGLSEVIVYAVADASVNASNNGGLHGIAHYSA